MTDGLKHAHREAIIAVTDQARLSAALEELPMAQTVDLILYDRVRDGTLREHIREHGIDWFRRLNSSVARQRH